MNKSKSNPKVSQDTYRIILTIQEMGYFLGVVIAACLEEGLITLACVVLLIFHRRWTFEEPHTPRKRKR